MASSTPLSPTHRKRSSRGSNKASKISFHPYVFIQEMRHINDMSPAEIEATWYQDADYVEMRNDCARIVKQQQQQQQQQQKKKRLDDGDIENNDMRGLEGRTAHGYRQRQANKRNAADAVLDEQEYQWDNEISNPRAIAALYRGHTQHCRRQAYSLAQQDAEYAKEYLAQMASSKWPSSQANNSQLKSCLKKTPPTDLSALAIVSPPKLSLSLVPPPSTRNAALKIIQTLILAKTRQNLTRTV